jgi:hypothetical protein
MFEIKDELAGVYATITKFGTTHLGTNSTIFGGARLNVNAAGSLIGVIVRGNATGDLQQWQNSGGTSVARIDSGGNLKATNLATLNSIGQLAESNSGALFVMGRATAQASSPGLNTGTLYFRDGSTTGTLRIATRTGASGVEETIVDNLSSTGSTAGAQFVGAGGVRTTGLINTNSSQYGNNILWSAPASTTYYLLATLPISTAGTYDHLKIDAMYGVWTGGTMSTSTYIFSNRDAFVWKHYLSGAGVLGNVKLRAYSQVDGSVQIWASGEAGQFMKFAYNISSAQNVTTVAIPVSTTTAPSGTVVFDSSNVSTYPPVENKHGALNILGTTSGTIPFSVRGASGQSVNLQEWQAAGSPPTTLASIDSSGRFNSTTAGNFGGFPAGSAFLGVQTSANTVGALIRGGALQLNHLLLFQNSTPTSIGGVNANSQIWTGSTTPLTVGAGGGINGVSANGTTVTISTTNAHNLSNGDRVTIAGLTPAGYNGTYIISGVGTFSFNIANTTTGTATGSGTVVVDSQASITSRSAATVGLLVRGAASQVVNPFEVQNSSGVVIANVTAGGSVRATATLQGASLSAVSDGSTVATLSSSGNIQFRGAASYGGGVGVIGIANATTAPSTNPSAGGVLFVNSGALQYRGTGGGNTTIVNADGTIPIFSANNTFTGVQAFNNTVNIGSGVSGSVGLEIGSTNGTGTTPFIDFHSGATAIDFDSRIIASGGTGTNGAGTLTYTAATNTFAGSINTAFGLSLTGTTSPLTLNGSAGTTGQVLTSAGSGTTPTWSSSFISTTSNYFAGHNPEGRLMYNTYLTNDMANARLRGSAVAATQNGSAYTISNANWDAMFDGTATFFNISPVSGFTFPLVITVPLPRTLTYGTWVGISFGSTTFRANSVQIEVFSLDSNSWVTVVNTTTNTSEDIFAAVSGLTNGNATGINQIRYTISNPNSTQLRLQHLWAYNFNSDMWSQTMMPRAGGAFYGAISVPGAVTMTGALNVNTTGTGTINLGDGQISKAPGSGFTFNSGLNNVTSLGVGVSALNTEPFRVYLSNATHKTLIRGAASQVEDLIEFQSSAGTVLSGTNAVGQAFTGSTTPILTATGGTIQSIATGANPLVTMASAHGFTTGDLVTLAGTTGGTYNGTFSVASTPASTTFTITSALTAGQAGTGGTASDPAQLSVTARSPGTIGAVIRSAASQTASVFETQDVSGTTRFYIDAAHNTNFSSSSWLQNSTGRLTLGLTSNTAVGLTVRGTGAGGVYTQTANLQEWQTWNGTTATTVAYVRNDGVLRATAFGTLLNYAWTAERNSGGELNLTKQTAQTTSPSADNGKLYFRDGTTAGTLKFVARTGIAGVEETIVDNLSSTGSTAGATFVGAGGVTTTGAGSFAALSASGNLSITNGNIGNGTATNIVLASGSNRSVTLASGTPSLGGGANVVFIGNATTAPTSNPTGGGILYVESGALKYRGTSNADATIVNADGTRSLLDPLLTSVSTVGGGGSEGGQINFARVTDGTRYWNVDSFGSTSSPDLRFIEDTNERFRFIAGGAFSVGGQSGTSGQVLSSSGSASSPTWRSGPVDATTTTAATGFGYMGLPQNATTTGSYTIVAGDAGEHIYASSTRTITIPANGSVAFPVGTTITFIAGSGATMTIAITSDTMYLAGPGTTGSRTLAPFGMATAVKITSTSWIISGNGLT